MLRNHPCLLCGGDFVAPLKILMSFMQHQMTKPTKPIHRRKTGLGNKQKFKVYIEESYFATEASPFRTPDIVYNLFYKAVTKAWTGRLY